jgi:hypothetical protein
MWQMIMEDDDLPEAEVMRLRDGYIIVSLLTSDGGQVYEVRHDDVTVGRARSRRELELLLEALGLAAEE